MNEPRRVIDPSASRGAVSFGGGRRRLGHGSATHQRKPRVHGRRDHNGHPAARHRDQLQRAAGVGHERTGCGSRGRLGLGRVGASPCHRGAGRRRGRWHRPGLPPWRSRNTPGRRRGCGPSRRGSRLRRCSRTENNTMKAARYPAPRSSSRSRCSTPPTRSTPVQHELVDRRPSRRRERTRRSPELGDALGAARHRHRDDATRRPLRRRHGDARPAGARGS